MRIDHTSATPPFEQLKAQIVASRANGEFPVGHRLPPVRALAGELGLAPNTVAKAYRELEASGIIETRGRNGSFVTGSAESAHKSGLSAARTYLAAIRALGLPDAEAGALIREASTSTLDSVFGDARDLLFVHAHPDDETISTGALIAALVASGRRCYVLTATRGEQGEVRPGALPAGVDLVAHREAEWARACAALGVEARSFLGTPPARSAGLPRRYTDSGMTWLDEAETLAGPGPDAGPDALTSAPVAEIAADIAAYARAVGADALVTYDALGGYGHPDHVALHAPTRAAASELGLPFFEIVSQPRGAAPAPDAHWLDLADTRPTVARALGAYASQLAVDGDHLAHVGGQREPIQVRVGVRPMH